MHRRAEGSARRRSRHHPHHGARRRRPAPSRWSTSRPPISSSRRTRRPSPAHTQEAISIYRRIVSDFPESQFAPVCLFNIAAIYDGQGDLPATIATLRELVKAYPKARESIDGHLYIAALQADHEQFADANATLDEVLARDQPHLRRPGRGATRARATSLLELQQLRRRRHGAPGRRSPSGARRQPHRRPVLHRDGELLPRRGRAPQFLEAPVRLPDDQEVADLEAEARARGPGLRLLEGGARLSAGVLGDRVRLPDVADLRGAVGGDRQGAVSQEARGDPRGSTSPTSTTASASTSRRRSRATA